MWKATVSLLCKLSKFCLIVNGRCWFRERQITGGFSLSLQRTENDLYKRECCSILAARLAFTLYYQYISHFHFSLSVYTSKAGGYQVKPRHYFPLTLWRDCGPSMAEFITIITLHLHPQPFSIRLHARENIKLHVNMTDSYCDSLHCGCSISDELCSPADFFSKPVYLHIFPVDNKPERESVI